jgi:SRSO17 transposase
LARRSVSQATEIAYYLAYAPTEVPLLTLAQVAASRYTVEQCIEEAKGETGLDEYEVRYWHSWYRHITLSMMAHAWLAFMCAKAQDKKNCHGNRGIMRASLLLGDPIAARCRHRKRPDGGETAT